MIKQPPFFERDQVAPHGRETCQTSRLVRQKIIFLCMFDYLMARLI